MERHHNSKWDIPARDAVGNSSAYDQWNSLRKRCKATGNNKLHYSGVSYVPEWESYDVWVVWARQQLGFLSVDEKGWIYECDKDILLKGNKVYCPELCVFVPKEINTFYLKIRRSRGDTPIGVTYNRKNGNFVSQINQNRVNTYLGSYRTALEAHKAYAERKVELAKQLAVKYTGLVDPRVVAALNNFTVSIND